DGAARMGALGLGLAVLLLAIPSSAQVTERVNLSSAGSQANHSSDLPARGDFVSSDGRYVAFSSTADNLVAGGTNGAWDIFLRDRLTSTTERVSVDSAGNQCNGGCGLFGISISSDGR